MRNKVQEAREVQKERFKKLNAKILINSEMTSKMCDEMIELDKEPDKFLKDIFEKSLLSARGYYRILKTARTIADLENAKDIKISHLAEAFQYRLRENS